MTDETKATIKILDRISDTLAENIWIIRTDKTIIPAWLEGEEFKFSCGNAVFDGRTGYMFLEELAGAVPYIAAELAKPV
jgi:hypothetical protein